MSSPKKEKLKQPGKSSSSSISSSSSRSLPKLVGAGNFPGDSFDSAPLVFNDQFERLSGHKNPTNSTGLYAEVTEPKHPSRLCVRCGTTHASLCMPCADLMCEQAITFYRKTRAAGTAVLFQKAFVEAGNSKLVKFFLFRLWKNSCIRLQQKEKKMRMVAERLFGNNITFMPFNAWKRYARENILERKNKTIETLNEKLSILERNCLKIGQDNETLQRKINNLEDKLDQTKQTLLDTIMDLEESEKLKAQETRRVIGLTSLAYPLKQYSEQLAKIMTHDAEEMRHFISSSKTSVVSHNYADILKDPVLERFTEASNEEEYFPSDEEEYFPSDEEKAEMPKRWKLELAISREFAVQWVNKMSVDANHKLDMGVEKRAYERCLPPHEDIHTLSDVKSGNSLIRIVLSIIIENKKVSERMKHTNVVRGAFYQFFEVHIPHMEELLEVQNKVSSEERIHFILDTAENILNVPRFNRKDILQGNEKSIHALLMCLMNNTACGLSEDEQVQMGDQLFGYEEVQSRLKAKHTKFKFLNEIIEARSAHIGDSDLTRQSREHSMSILKAHAISRSLRGSMDSLGSVDGISVGIDEAVKKAVSALTESRSTTETYEAVGAAIDKFLEVRETKTIVDDSMYSGDTLTKLVRLKRQMSNFSETRMEDVRLTQFFQQFFVNNALRSSLDCIVKDKYITSLKSPMAWSRPRSTSPKYKTLSPEAQGNIKLKMPRTPAYALFEGDPEV